jgi:hypothetical protein
MFPVRLSGMQRLIGLASGLDDQQTLGFEDIRTYVEALLDIKVTQVNWFSTYRVHHRIADKFRVGRAFLLGMPPHTQSCRWSGHEHWDRRRYQPRLEACPRVADRADVSLLDSYGPKE